MNLIRHFLGDGVLYSRSTGGGSAHEDDARHGCCFAAALSFGLAGCNHAADDNRMAAADAGAVPAMARVRAMRRIRTPSMRPMASTIRPGVSNCANPNAAMRGEPGRPPDPIYPAYWQSRWTMYRVFANYAQGAAALSRAPPPGLVAGRDYEVSYGATYYDSTWKGPGGEGAMMEHYEKRCLPIFPGIPNNFTCSFISLGDTAFFLTYPQDRPKGMPPACLFSPVNHPPRRDFITHLPYSPGDSAQLGAGGQAYSFWVGGDGKPFQTGVAPDQTANGGVMFGYAFAPANGKLLPQSFYFSGFPLTAAQRALRQPELQRLPGDQARPGQDLGAGEQPRPEDAAGLHGDGRAAIGGDAARAGRRR